MVLTGEYISKWVCEDVSSRVSLWKDANATICASTFGAAGLKLRNWHIEAALFLCGRDGVPYCEADYHAQYGVKCETCTRYISGRVLEVRTNARLQRETVNRDLAAQHSAPDPVDWASAVVVQSALSEWSSRVSSLALLEPCCAVGSKRLKMKGQIGIVFCCQQTKTNLAAHVLAWSEPCATCSMFSPRGTDEQNRGGRREAGFNHNNL